MVVSNTNFMHNIGRQMSKEEQLKGAFSPNFKTLLRRKKLSWFGHIVRIAPERVPKRTYICEPGGKRSKRPQRQRSDDTLLRDLNPMFKTIVCRIEPQHSLWRRYVDDTRQHDSKYVASLIKITFKPSFKPPKVMATIHRFNPSNTFKPPSNLLQTSFYLTWIGSLPAFAFGLKVSLKHSLNALQTSNILCHRNTDLKRFEARLQGLFD